MEILGIGFPELVFILIVALIVMGPKDMEKTGRTIGKWLRDFVTSDSWKVFQQTSREIRTLPNRLMREANIEKDMAEMRKIGQDIKDVNPLDTLNDKFPAKNQPPVATSPSGQEYPAPSAQGERNAPPAETPKDESDSQPNA